MLRFTMNALPDAAGRSSTLSSPGEHSAFASFAQSRATFASVDKVGERYVFNIGGNKYRLVAAIAFQAGLMWVKAVLTHSEYDKGAWK